MYFAHLFYILYKINEKYYGRRGARIQRFWYVMFYINIYEDENHVIYALAIFRDICAKSLEPTTLTVFIHQAFNSNIR